MNPSKPSESNTGRTLLWVVAFGSLIVAIASVFFGDLWHIFFQLFLGSVVVCVVCFWAAIKLGSGDSPSAVKK
ncbi:MAG: hypothetical protein V1837_05000 [Candidatus Woesearchaeota archaeon]